MVFREIYIATMRSVRYAAKRILIKASLLHNEVVRQINPVKSRTITFKNKEHENFYRKYLPQCRYQDVYHKALVYCLGIDRDTRDHVKQIYDFRTGDVKPECLREGWQTSGSVKIVRMAFNLYCNGTPSIYNYEEDELAGLEEMPVIIRDLDGMMTPQQ